MWEQFNPRGKCGRTYLALILFALSVFVWNIYIYSFGSDFVNHDPFNRKIVNINWLENCCSWWPILHFIGFFILGWWYPYCDKLLFIAGVVWELFEVAMNRLIRGTVKKQPMRISTGNVEYSDIWWAGSFKDILFNTAGIYLGRCLRLKYNPPKSEEEDFDTRRFFRRNWQGGAAMLRGDLIIDPGQQSWFQHDMDYRDLTPGYFSY